MTLSWSHCKACVSECTRTCSAPPGISDPEIIEFLKGKLVSISWTKWAGIQTCGIQTYVGERLVFF